MLRRNACSLGLGYGDGSLFGSGGFIPVLVFGVLGSFFLTGRRSASFVLMMVPMGAFSAKAVFTSTEIFSAALS